MAATRRGCVRSPTQKIQVGNFPQFLAKLNLSPRILYNQENYRIDFDMLPHRRTLGKWFSHGLGQEQK
jgi:hypothetical protein